MRSGLLIVGRLCQRPNRAVDVGNAPVELAGLAESHGKLRVRSSSEQALLAAQIHPVALAQARRIPKNAVEGWTEPNGARVRPSPRATRAALGELAAVWRETALRDRIVAWGLSRDDRRPVYVVAHYLTGLLDAFEDVSFTSDERRRVGAAIAERLRWPTDTTFVHARAPGLLRDLTTAGLAGEARRELEALVAHGHPLAVHAAVALATVEQRRFAEWSARASHVAPHIQLGEMTEAARTWIARAGHLDLPWFQTDWHELGFRLADLLRGLLFEAEAADQLAVE